MMTIIDELLVRFRHLLFTGLALALLAAVIYGLAHRPPPVTLTIVPPAPTALPTTAPTQGPVRVHVAGAVARPGVYSLPPGAAVDDAIQAAGGPSSDADMNRLNLAAAAQDEQQILVPHQQTTLVPQDGAVPADAGTTLASVNVNIAEKETLETLPGVGPVLADRIIAYRQTIGPFNTLDDLLAVKGIGETTLDKLRPWITLGP
jgi:competence protein ComEA